MHKPSRMQSSYVCPIQKAASFPSFETRSNCRRSSTKGNAHGLASQVLFLRCLASQARISRSCVCVVFRASFRSCCIWVCGSLRILPYSWLFSVTFFQPFGCKLASFCQYIQKLADILWQLEIILNPVVLKKYNFSDKACSFLLKALFSSNRLDKKRRTHGIYPPKA